MIVDRWPMIVFRYIIQFIKKFLLLNFVSCKSSNKSIDHRPPTTDHRPPTIDHRSSTIDYQSIQFLNLNILKPNSATMVLQINQA